MAFEKGNKYSQEWTLENALPRFVDALEYSRSSDDCLCLQDAIAQTGIPYSTFDYLANNHDVLRLIKESIKNEVIRRVNRLAINDLAPASPAIWRMKQLGERDEQHINQTGTTKTEITVNSKEAQKEVDDLIQKFESE